MIDRHAYALPFGAQLIASGRTRFRLWAPDADAVSVDIAGAQPAPMTRAGDSGWFETEAACGAGARYRYRIRPRAGDELMVPDPASRAQDGDVHDASIVVDPAAYQWRHAEWTGRPWHETVLYELHVGALGGFEGVMQRLPALAAMGITAVELMPIADFPGPRNWGYDGVLPYAPDAAYGTPEQLKALIDTAHGLGMMVFLDVVYNHFGPDGNYLGAYAGAFFRDDVRTPWGQAIDFRRPEVSSFFIENAVYWLKEYRFDGLRFDAVHAISEQQWLEVLSEQVRAAIEPGRHVHLVLEHDGNAAHLLERSHGRLFDAQWNDDGHHVLHVLLTGEDGGYYSAYADDTAARLARCMAEGFVYQGEPAHNGEPRGEPSAHLPPTSFVLFLQNHDQIGNRAFGERLSTLADPQALRAASALLLLSPQIPMLFMGEEFGATQPFLYFTSHPDPKLADAVREGRRQEFARFPAFSDPQTRERIPDPNDERTFRASIPLEVAGSTWPSHTAGLLALRKTHVMPRLPGARSIGAQAIGPAAVVARWRMGDGTTLVIAINLANTETSASLDALSNPSGADLLFETDGALACFAAGKLPAYGFVALLEPRHE
ncbi:MAG: treZ [Noviherbaspirillum sp.]|nr:treZ [Noviherbaspirillum sp.]